MKRKGELIPMVIDEKVSGHDTHVRIMRSQIFKSDQLIAYQQDTQGNSKRSKSPKVKRKDVLEIVKLHEGMSDEKDGFIDCVVLAIFLKCGAVEAVTPSDSPVL